MARGWNYHRGGKDCPCKDCRDTKRLDETRAKKKAFIVSKINDAALNDLREGSKQQTIDSGLNIDDVIVSVCDCTHTQACSICGESKGIDMRFLDD